MALPPGYVVAAMRSESREKMRQLMYRLSSETGARVSISDTISVACDIAMRHIDECITEVKPI